jgi:DNA-binding NtrC family response regulator
MSKRKGTVLIIDDEEEIRESIELLLTSEGLSTDTAENGEIGLKKIEDNLYDAVLLDLMLPGKSGMEIQKDIKRIDPTLPIVIITAIGALETAVTAIKEGSFDYVTKPWNNEKLVVIVNNAIKQRHLMSENLQLRRALKERFGYSNIIGKSEKILKVLDLVTQVAASRSTVLIQGESGERTDRQSHPSQEPPCRQNIRPRQQRQHAGRSA